MIAVATYATKNYLYAFPQCIARIAAAVNHLESGHFIFATDLSKEARKAAELLETELPENWNIHIITHDFSDDLTENYKAEAQKRIAILQSNCFKAARKLKCKYFWSVESDVLVHPDSLKLSQWVLEMPDNYYDIAMVTYPNGSFLGGRGSYSRPIEQNFSMEERNLPEKLIDLVKNSKTKLENLSKSKSDSKNQEEKLNYQKLIDKEIKRLQRLDRKIEKYPPTGNIFEVNGKYGWKPRGWLDHAYPAIGKGAILPTDWVGLGCTLLNQRALSLATFDGYGPEFAGTQDLFLVANRWRPEGLKMAVITHVVCDHVKYELNLDKSRKDSINHYVAFHEKEGLCEGHLRVNTKNWSPI